MSVKTGGGGQKVNNCFVCKGNVDNFGWPPTVHNNRYDKTCRENHYLRMYKLPETAEKNA